MGADRGIRRASRRHGLIGFFLLTALIALPAVSHANVVRVPANQPTVRLAVDAAASGDTVLIAPGTWDGGVWVNGKSLTIASQYLLSGDTSLVAQTVLNRVVGAPCNGAPGCVGNAVLEFGPAAHGSAVIGLTVSGGENGVSSASVVDIVHCRVIDNGDGVDYVDGSGGTFRNSLFANNSDDGIDLNGRLSGQILDNVIRDNRDDGIEYRLYAYNGPVLALDIVGNRITGNGEDGIQIIDYPDVSSRVIRIDRNLFMSNFDASGSSAAIACMPNGETIENLSGAPIPERLVVTNNTFSGEQNGLVGGANVIALNNIFVGTSGHGVLRAGGNSITSYSLFWNNGVDHEASTVDLPHLVLADPALDADGRLTTGSPAIDAGTAFFQWQGETVLDLPSSAYLGSAPDLGAFEFGGTPPPVNTAPVVDAGPDQAVTLPAQAQLDGTVSDDGLPSPPTLTTTWSVASGPAAVTFQDAGAVDTRATFTVAGTYVLRLTASDRELSTSDLVQVTVANPPPVNTAPVVSAGPDLSVSLPEQALLDGSVSDDGLPSPPALTTTWSVVSGPAAVTFEDASAVDTRATFTVAGTYVLQLTANDGELGASDRAQVTVGIPSPGNTAPVVDAGPDQSVTLPGQAQLDGTVSDDGLPVPATLTTAWSVASGPGAVTFEDASAVDTRASFAAPGVYVLRLTASDGEFTGRDVVQITAAPAPPVNTAPVVNAGADQSVTLPAQAQMNGTVSDDGLPSPPSLTTTWSLSSGPAAVTFVNPNALDTQVRFSIAGTYVLRLTASDGELSGSDLVQISVAAAPPVNTAPVVNAGPDQTVTLPEAAQLDGTVSDDGLPSPAALATTWAMETGPGQVTFADARAADTRATFGVAGTYVLRLTADDGQLSASDLVQITVGLPPGALERRVAAASDDAEEEASGAISGNVSDLELVDNGNLQTVGIRFTDVAIPAGARVMRSYVQFEADETQSELTQLIVHGEAADDAATFTTEPGNVSGRPRTVATASWSPAPWTLVGQAGAAQRTTDLSAVVQEIVDRPGRASAGAIALIITGTGHRTARSFEGRAAGAALLHVEYELAAPPPVNTAPVVDAGPDRFITLPAQAHLDGLVSDDGLPSPPALVTTWSVASGPAPVTFDDPGAVDTRATFTAPGSYLLQLTASDGELSGSDQVAITVQVESGPVDRVIAASGDDIEEDATGVMNLSSTDLELVFNVDNQTIGLRFTDIAVPQGAVIVRAHIQFETDEVNTETTQLVIQGQAADDAGSFTGRDGDASSRPRTAASVGWSPAPWTTVGEAGDAQRTPDLSPVFQEIVNRSGWTKGNAVAILITGTGHRTAVSYDGSPNGAARLHLEYGSPQNLAPVVDAGRTLDLMQPAETALAGRVTDDGLPLPAALTVTWTVASGPGPVTFENPNGVDTRATFDELGTYLLHLTASDGELSTTDEVMVRVHPASGTMDRTIAASSDDVEEDPALVMNLASLDLEMSFNESEQKVGLRFLDVAVPPGARVTRAYVQFVADETHSDATALVIHGQASDAAETFLSTGGDLTGRAHTEASVFWAPAAWEFEGEAGDAQRTPDLSSVLQEIVDRPGWESGHAVAVFISGTGHRTAVSFDANPAAAPRLHVEYGRSGAALNRRAIARPDDPTLPAVTPRFALALHGPTANPVRGGALDVAFSLPGGGAASLELVDVTGRRVAIREVGTLGAGRHQVDLARGLPAGIYLVRLTRDRLALMRKAVVLN